MDQATRGGVGNRTSQVGQSYAVGYQLAKLIENLLRFGVQVQFLQLAPAIPVAAVHISGHAAGN